jgi:hypothetical protein
MRRTDCSIHDPHRDLQQPLAQRRGLRRGTGRPRRMSPQGLDEDVGREREQEPELIAEKPRATQPIQRQAGFEFFDPVLDIPAGALERVHVRGRVRQVGDHEAGIVLRGAARMPHDLGLD